MSDNIPSTSIPRKKSKRKYDKTKLPTPPPDPPIETTDFLSYLDCLQKSRSNFAPILATEDAFDHLEKLYRLMEQMLELREQNVRLQRRIRDLEHLNNLEKMRKDLEDQIQEDCPELDKDTAFAETILESILSESKTPKQKLPRVEERAKVSKWTKVKAAFKWEKASGVSDTKSQDSGIGPMEVAKYLRVPSCDDHGHSPVDSGAAEISTPATLSSASSTEDFNGSDDDHNYNMSHSNSTKSTKSHKTPWAKMKDIIHTRNSFRKKHEEASSDCDEVFLENDLPPDVVARYQKELQEEDFKKVSKWIKVKNAFLPPPESIEDEIQKNYKQLQKKLSLEFQDKINEWERMKQNSPNPSTEEVKLKPQQSVKIQMTSEENLPPEFRKKLQEWEKIRKSSSRKKMADYPNLSDDFRKKLEEWKQIKASPKQLKKSKDNLQWVETELNKIEKEKQLLENEKLKFLEREEALTKLRNQVVDGLKKEVLVHTPTGFYKFEGINRKFTQKLYEWEKARGIEPESSTFALLIQNKKEVPNLVRSKSADSVTIGPLISHQPSSLSLNNVDELEKELVDDEPEALIVEVEDIIEETAAPLPTYKTQKPIYKQELTTMCEGETTDAPKVRRSESAKAQNNYNLIEEIFSILKNLTENETEIQKSQDLIEENEECRNTELIRLKMFDESQKAMSSRLNEKLQKLQEANSSVFSSITKDESFTSKQLVETLENVQDLSLEIYQLSEKLDYEISDRNIYEIQNGACSLNPILETAKNLKLKMLELRRRLSYICAASDLTAPRKKSKRLYVKADQSIVKKRTKYRKKSQKNLTDTEDDDDEMDSKKLIRTKSEPKGTEELYIDENLIQKVIVPTQSNLLEMTAEEKKVDSPVTVFVKTTRKLFTPIVESGLKEEEKSKVNHLPPIPSPVAPKKAKDISPSIRLMMAKYNQKLEDSNSVKSNSSDSASPPPWRSPSSERRSVKAQTERYQEEIQKSTNREVQKSASASFLHQQTIVNSTSPVKSSSLANFANDQTPKPSDSRLQKLQKAKEEFLKAEPKSTNEQPIKFPDRNRLSQISVGNSESSLDTQYGMLIKSASAGMINIDADVYKQIDPEIHGGGYVSLPRNTKQKAGFLNKKFAFANIASKFRKVKMKKGKMNAVSTLCRQSLVVDIQKQLDETNTEKKEQEETKEKCKWIKRKKFFKK